ARDIRKKKVEHISDQAQRRRIGQINDASQTAELDDVLQQEADLTAGHGVLRVSGLIAVSANTKDELDAAVAKIEQAAIQASCETHQLVGQQALASTAAVLPLCRSLSRIRLRAPDPAHLSDPVLLMPWEAPHAHVLPSCLRCRRGLSGPPRPRARQPFLRTPA